MPTNLLFSSNYEQSELDFTGQKTYNSCNELKEKSTVSCGNNQRCLFNHSVIAHATVESILCANSRSKIKEQSTMLTFQEQVSRQQQIETPVIRKTYSQDWKNYNLAQTNEKSRLLELLYELCTQIEDIPRKDGAGRNRIPLADMVFSLVYKIYSGIMSFRRE